MRNSLIPAIILLTSLFVSRVNAQNHETLARFIITDASINGEDITERVVANGAFITLYRPNESSKVYMANVWPVAESQSYGPIHSMRTESIEETDEVHEADIFRFNWRYQNTYDGKKGTARVELVKIYKPQGVAFTITIIPEDLDVALYRGYMEGSLDFSALETSF